MSLKSDLNDFLNTSGFRPRKRWGQNFLIDENIRDKIIKNVNIKESNRVLEIGPGLGALSEKIISLCGLLNAVEIDKFLCKYLEEKFSSKTNFHLLNKDFLKLDFKELNPEEKLILVGNLPYYISSPIIEHIIKNRSRIKSAFITVQKEFGNRLTAKEGTKDYSALTCFVKYYTKPRFRFIIKKNSFYPVPSVDSVFLELEILDKPSLSVKDERLFFKIIRGSFNKRRKKLINSLSCDEIGLKKDELRNILKKLGFDLEIRGEKLKLEDFGKLSDEIYDYYRKD